MRRSENIFSKIVFAFQAMALGSIVRNLKYSRTSVQAVFHFIDYLFRLPKDLEQKLAQTMYPVLGREKELMQLYNKENASPTIANTFEMERIEGKMKGKIEGRVEERRNIALNLLKQNLSIDMIATATGLTIEEVRELKCEKE